MKSPSRGSLARLLAMFAAAILFGDAASSQQSPVYKPAPLRADAANAKQRRPVVSTPEEITQARKHLSSIPPNTKIGQLDGSTRTASELLTAITKYEAALPSLRNKTDSQAVSLTSQQLDPAMLQSFSTSGDSDSRPQEMTGSKPHATFAFYGQLICWINNCGSGLDILKGAHTVIKYKLKPEWVFTQVNIIPGPNTGIVSITGYGTTDLTVTLAVGYGPFTVDIKPAYQGWVYVKPNIGGKPRNAPNPATRPGTKPE